MGTLGIIYFMDLGNGIPALNALLVKRTRKVIRNRKNRDSATQNIMEVEISEKNLVDVAGFEHFKHPCGS